MSPPARLQSATNPFSVNLLLTRVPGSLPGSKAAPQSGAAFFCTNRSDVACNVGVL